MNFRNKVALITTGRVRQDIAIVVLAGVLCLAGACSGSKMPAPSAGATSGELPKTVTDDLERVLQQYDPAAFGQLLAENARLMPANIPAIEGREAILAYYKGAVTPELHWELTGQKSATVGPVGLAEGLYRIKKVSDGQYVESGKYLSVWVNQDGAWKLLRLMSSPDHQVSQGSIQVEGVPTDAPKP